MNFWDGVASGKLNLFRICLRLINYSTIYIYVYMHKGSTTKIEMTDFSILFILSFPAKSPTKRMTGRTLNTAKWSKFSGREEATGCMVQLIVNCIESISAI